MNSTAMARAAMLATALLVGACAGGPPAEPVAERTDERTAITVATLPKPLLFTGARTATGVALDLAVGPFELNRQGRKTWFVWVSLLGEDLAASRPHLRLTSGTETVLDLAPVPVDAALPISTAPYEKPAPWATERYYEISAEDVGRLYGQRTLEAEIARADGTVWRFEPWDVQLDRLDAYLAEKLQGRVATR